MNENAFTAAFSDYKDVTDLEALIKASQTPLRKCVRVNTLKMSITDFVAYAKNKEWALTPVEWCQEGFFIDRPMQSEALGKDVLHILGYFYIQEASSMLPACLLNPQPGDYVLDMSAAPGSKTVQMSAMMKGEGIIVANDIQPKRLQTLKSACYRLGATNTVLTQKKGQWFGYGMNEKFDRVLCDAPCSAQGTVRKDSSALDFFRNSSIHSLAHIQFELLDSALSAAKIGGRVVYSTCTLTIEENEAIIAKILAKYPQTVSVLHPDSASVSPWNTKLAIIDAEKVQKSAHLPEVPVLRLWPQTYNTEGFFCAVLQKTGHTSMGEFLPYVHLRERVLRRRQVEEISTGVQAQFGTDFLLPHETLIEHDGTLYLVHKGIEDVRMPIRNFCAGIEYGKLLQTMSVRVCNTLAIARGHMATKNTIDLKDDQFVQLMKGQNLSTDLVTSGDVLLFYKGLCFGVCLYLQGKIKNTIDRDIIAQYLQ